MCGSDDIFGPFSSLLCAIFVLAIGICHSVIAVNGSGYLINNETSHYHVYAAIDYILVLFYLFIFYDTRFRNIVIEDTLYMHYTNY